MLLTRRHKLNVTSSEHFHDALIAQYQDLIKEAIFESETDHKTRIDIGKLNMKLKVIYKAAQYDGLDENTISELIDMAMPSSALAA